jgi:predicted O-linked N-acetylglucosamine transferase (SPINDLY family)
MENQDIVNEIIEKIKSKKNYEETYNSIQNSLIERKITENIFYNLLNMFFMKSHVYTENTEKLLIFYIKGRLKLDIVTDDIIYAKLDNAESNVEFMLMIFLLVKPKILYTSEQEIFSHNSQVHKNLDRLIDYSLLNPKFTFNSADHFKSISLLNYSYYHVYNGLGNKEMYIKFAKLWKLLCPDLVYNKPCIKNIYTNKIKIGFASCFLMQNQSVCRDRIGIIRFLILDNRFDVYLFTTSPKEEAIYNVVINSIGFKNKILLEENIESARKIIGDHNLDILVYPEIGMDFFYYLLAFSRLAPIQINTWGHSETCGINTIDYYFSSKYYELEDSEKFYSEKIVKLDSLCTYYYSLRIFDFSKNIIDSSQEKLRVEKNLPKNGIIYGIFQTVFKYHPTNIKIIKEILYLDPKAIIIMLTYEDLEERFIDYLDKNLSYQTNRIRIFSRSNLYEYTKLIKCVDIILDSYPFGGCNSTLEAFFLNKVVITLPSEKINGRFTYGFYKKMDIMEPICYTQDEFINKSIFYANNKQELKKIENKIAKNSHKLFEEEDSITTWKDKLIELYNEHYKNLIYNEIN